MVYPPYPGKVEGKLDVERGDLPVELWRIRLVLVCPDGLDTVTALAGEFARKDHDANVEPDT